MGLFVAPIMLGLRRLAKANLLQLPLQPPDESRPEVPRVLSMLEGIARETGVDKSPPPEAPPKARDSRRKARRIPQAISLEAPAECRPALDALRERPGPIADSDWVPAVRRLELGILGPFEGPRRVPKGGFLKSTQPASKLLSVLILAERMRSMLIYSASIEYLRIRSSWERNYDPFPIPPKARRTAIQEGHRAFKKVTESVGNITPTEDTLNYMGIPSYVIRKKFCLLSSKQKALATLGRLAQSLFNRGQNPRVRGFAVRLGRNASGIVNYARFPPNNWRRALRLISRQVVSTYAFTDLSAGHDA